MQTRFLAAVYSAPAPRTHTARGGLLRTSSFALGLLALCLNPSLVCAQLTQSSPVFVMDLTGDAPVSTVVSVNTFNDALASVLPPPGRIADVRENEGIATPIERVTDACRVPPAGAALGGELDAQTRLLLQERSKMIDALQGCVKCLKAHQELRFHTDRGEDVLLIVLFRSAKPDEIVPTFIETPRSSELAATARAMLGLLRTTEKESSPIDCRAFPYTLLYRRSIFKVTVTYPSSTEVETAAVRKAGLSAIAAAAQPEGRPDNNAPQNRLLSGAARTGAAAAPAADTTSEATTPVATLGPSERWIVSADFSVPVTDFKLGAQPTVNQEQLKKKDFFVALNFAFGDLLVDRGSVLQKRSILKDLLLKIQVTPSKRPWEAWALGVGLRGERFKSIFWSFDVLHPYFTFGAQEDDAGEQRWRGVFGLGFDPRSLVKK